MKLYDPVHHDGVFDILGAGFNAIATLNAARGTTVPREVEDFLQRVPASSDLTMAATMEGLPAATSNWQSTGASLAEQIRRNCGRLLIAFVEADQPQPERSITNGIKYLIERMVSDGAYVAANAVSLDLVPHPNNAGDVAICYSARRGDGRVQENAIAETIDITIGSATSTSPILRCTGQAGIGDRLSHAWPAGSGCRTTLTAIDAAHSLLSNGDFEQETIDDTPDQWIVHVGRPGTTVKCTRPEVQTVTISGTPTGGSYVLQWTNPAGITRSTIPLAYNATGSAVQSALRAIPALGQVTVSTSGTSPDYEHTITFVGVAGDISQLTSVNHLTGGNSPTITHATTRAGNPGSYKGKALALDSDGTELTALYHPLWVTADTVYFCHLRLRRVGATAAGQFRIEIVDGIDGNIVLDRAGQPNALSIDVTTISTDKHDSAWFSFRVPVTVAQPVYLRMRISQAVDDTATLFIDEVAIAEGRELYAGGPYVAAFNGTRPPLPTDRWTLHVTNDRAGALQTWFERCFDMSDKGLLLPTVGTSLIPDSVIDIDPSETPTTTTTEQPTTTTSE